MSPRRLVKFIATGQIRNEYIIDRTGKAHNATLGGSLLYAGAALKRWGGETGLLGVISQNFPREKIEIIAHHQLDIRGIKTIPETTNTNIFYAYPNDQDPILNNPVAVYAAHQLPLPRELIDPPENGNSTSKISLDNHIFLEDIPSDYLGASAAHICPLEIPYQLQLSTLLQRGAIRTMTIQLDAAGMVPEKLDEIAVLAKDATALVTREIDLRTLFQAGTGDSWELMERLCEYGSQYILVKNASNGYSLFERERARRYRIPDYPVNKIDPTGEMDVFCGAFLAGLHETYDALYAFSLAAVAASIKVEGTGPFFIEDSLPGLDQARVDFLRNKVIRY